MNEFVGIRIYEYMDITTPDTSTIVSNNHISIVTY